MSTRSKIAGVLGRINRWWIKLVLKQRQIYIWLTLSKPKLIEGSSISKVEIPMIIPYDNITFFYWRTVSGIFGIRR